MPGSGASALGIANAALYTISMAEGFKGVSALSKLKLRIKNKATGVIIEKYLEDAEKLRAITVENL